MDRHRIYITLHRFRKNNLKSRLGDETLEPLNGDNRYLAYNMDEGRLQFQIVLPLTTCLTFYHPHKIS